MSVTDPLIKDLKGLVLRLFEEWKASGLVQDSNQDLAKFCEKLEHIFNKGLITKNQFFLKNNAQNPYNWMSSIDENSRNINFLYKSCLEIARKSHQSSLGKFRILIRACLVKKCLNYPLEYLVKSGSQSGFYTKKSIIGDEILCTIFHSVLLQSTKINFKLNLENSSFLDETWLIPQLLKLELVPCENIGLGVSFANDKAVIVDVQPNSVASEDKKINRGDVLLGLNGIRIDSSMKGRLNAIFKSTKGRPIQVQIIKAYHKDIQDIFPPIKILLLGLNLDLSKILQSEDVENVLEDENDHSNNVVQGRIAFSRPGYDATFLGTVNVGNRGNVKQIEKAISCILSSNSNGYLIDTMTCKRDKIPVTIEIGEISLRVFTIGTNNVIFKHSYMQISSCGSLADIPNYFAYICGEDNCELSSNFTCYVFHNRNIDDACTILQSIGQGFHRTHFAV